MYKKNTLKAVLLCACLVLCLSGCKDHPEKDEASNTKVAYTSQSSSPAPQHFPDDHEKEPASAAPVKESKEESSDAEQVSSAAAKDPDKSEKDSLDANTVFIGNSCLESLKCYGIIKESPIYYKVGLDIWHLMDYVDDSSNKSVREIIREGGFKNLVVVVGENELGCDFSVFKKEYSAVIDEIKSLNPDAKLYLHSVMPISREASERAQFGATKQNIDKLNEKIKALCNEKNITYLDPTPVLVDNDGYLVKKAANDGIHLEVKYSKVWAEFLKKNIG